MQYQLVEKLAVVSISAGICNACLEAPQVNRALQKSTA